MMQLIISGITVGALYALFSVGYSLTLRLGINNFAHGAVAVFGAWVACLGEKHGVSLPIAVMLGGVASAAISACIYRLAISPLLSQHRWSTILVSTFAVGIIVENALLLLNGPENFSLRQPFHPSPILVVEGLRFTRIQLILVVASFLLLGAILAILRVTSLGRKIRMTADDRELAELHGVNTGATVTATFLFAGMLAGAAGSLLALDYDLHASSGTMLLLKGYVASIVVGRGPIPVVLASYAIGISEALIARYISSEAMQAILFGLIIILLFARKGTLIAEAPRTV